MAFAGSPDFMIQQVFLVPGFTQVREISPDELALARVKGFGQLPYVVVPDARSIILIALDQRLGEEVVPVARAMDVAQAVVQGQLD